MRQHSDLFHPQRRRRPSEPAVHAPSAAEMRASDRQFARDVARDLEGLVRTSGCHQVIVAASREMLGILGPLSGPAVDARVTVHEIDRDLIRLAAPELQAYLAHHGLLPPKAAAD
jgi:hypothetical protein